MGAVKAVLFSFTVLRNDEAHLTGDETSTKGSVLRIYLHCSLCFMPCSGRKYILEFHRSADNIFYDLFGILSLESFVAHLAQRATISHYHTIACILRRPSSVNS